MGFYLLLMLFAGLLLFWFVLNNPAPKSAAVLTKAGPFILIAVGALLTFFRRGMIGLPLIFLGHSWWRRSRSMRPADYSGGQKTTVRSADLEMELDHDTGEIDGRVLTGHLKGTLLSSLGEEELLLFYLEISSDGDSLALLVSFLDRYHPNWRDSVDPDSFRKQGTGSSFENMSRQEAYQILGVEPGASQQEIYQAWRRLIKGVHPDHGGSAFLTAKINAAKDALLD
ncbi:MAG: DnaJ domain-containing protein [Desulfobulbaceae bacterium]|nr:DnaJ domain-containing protein [Desulfobulbaceae bacterium]